jgi:hypothetical protein
MLLSFHGGPRDGAEMDVTQEVPLPWVVVPSHRLVGPGGAPMEALYGMRDWTRAARPAFARYVFRGWRTIEAPKSHLRKL